VLLVKCGFRACYTTESARAIADIKNDLYNLGLLSGMAQSVFHSDLHGVDAAASHIRAGVAPYLQSFSEYPNVHALLEGAVEEIIGDYRAAAERNARQHGGNHNL